MIITLLSVFAIIAGFVMIKFDTTEDLGIGTVICGVIVLIVCGLLIGSAHIGVNINIKKNNVQYESLCKRLEIVNSEYEDVSKSDVIKDIAEWNEKVVSEKYWTYNPWTSWFYSKQITDAMQYIDVQEEEPCKWAEGEE